MYSSYSSRTNGCRTYITSYVALLNTCRPQDTKNVLSITQNTLLQTGQKTNSFTLSGRILGIKKGRQFEAIQYFFLLLEKIQMSAWLLYFILSIEHRQQQYTHMRSWSPISFSSSSLQHRATQYISLLQTSQRCCSFSTTEYFKLC